MAACGSEDPKWEVGSPTSTTTTTAPTVPSSVEPTTAPAAAPPVQAVPTFESAIDVISVETANRMSASWRVGCPVPLADLRLVSVTHVGFDGQGRKGELVVHEAVAEEIVGVFRSMFDAGFPIEQVRLIDEFEADDDRSMAANNTSAFNCRQATGSSRWSEHAYGKAIDINPVQNPFVTRSGAVLPPAGSAFVSRDPAPGLIAPDGPAVEAFDAIGWGWGGRWSSGKDYQHFSASGR